MGNKINIQEYFDKGTFVIPEYQRGYKWSVKENSGESSLEYFIKSIIKVNDTTVSGEYFIEAVTVVEEDDKIIIVDGQQRTTSLFLLFAYLGDNKNLIDKLKYAVREDSHNWLHNLVSEEEDYIKIENEDVQDIYYFKEALKQIENLVKEFEKKDLLSKIKTKVKLLYNIIPENKAVNTFISLNGLKAVMKDEELIKSDLLIKSSRVGHQNTLANNDEKIGIEWKIYEYRGRMARNWDKWLYWWNQKEVKDYFRIENNHPLYYLLVTYWNLNIKVDNDKFSFDNFKSKLLSNSINAQIHFEGLRKLQKNFEDLYKDWEYYNLLGLSFNSGLKRNDVLNFFIQNRNKIDELKRFTKWSLIGCTLNEIEDINNIKFQEKMAEVRFILEDRNLFESDGKSQAYIQLLRMNVLDMNKRKFDFEVFKTKSLEHICPQTPNIDDNEFVNSKEEIDKNKGINSIGNLVLLNGSTNSSLSNNTYEKKKQLLFDKIKEGFLLPHTLKVFSKSFKGNQKPDQTEGLFDKENYWLSEDVKKNKDYFFTEFDKYYGKQQ